jgi:hypothetical protein
LGAVTWACKKQKSLTLSSTEGEYRAMVNASKKFVWLQQSHLESGFQQQHLTTLWYDNQSSINLIKYHFQHHGNKQIHIHMDFIRKLIYDRVIEVLFFSTKD